MKFVAAAATKLIREPPIACITHANSASRTQLCADRIAAWSPDRVALTFYSRR